MRRPFPQAFNLYQESSFSQRRYTLGEHQTAPMYTVTLHSGWSGKPNVVLHNGPSDASPPLAAVDHNKFSSASTVTLPPPGVLPPSNSRPVVERILNSGGFGIPTHTFSIETTTTGPNGVTDTFPERFQWRHSSGNEVKSLGGRGSGWKLVRLSPDAPSPNGATFASDGREVVAVWAWASGSLTKRMKFKFLGTGASGDLGERWAVMTVASALKIWDRERRQRQAAAAGGGGGA